MKIICPICGKEEFVRRNPPLTFYSEGGTIDEDRPCAVCVNCGYTVWFTSSVPKMYIATKEKIDGINKLIEETNAKIEKLEKSTNDVRTHKEALSKMKSQLIFYRKSGVENKTTRMLEECIAEEEKIINEGVNKEIVYKVDSLKQDVKQLISKRESLERSIELIK